MKKPVKLSIYAIIAALMVALDQISKAHIVKYLKPLDHNIVWIKNVFELEYLENTGAAFSSFTGKQGFLITLTFIVLGFCIFEFVRIPTDRHYEPLRIAFLLVIGGAIGNMIDRLRQGYVVDFFYFVPINFPRFNVADIFVTVSIPLLFILFMWGYREEELDFLFTFKKKVKKQTDKKQ